MTSIPTLAFVADNKRNLDIAAKFLIAAALPSAGIAAAPTNVPPVASFTKTAGVAAALLPSFYYDSTLSPTELHSKFSLLLPMNQRLATMLDSKLAGIGTLSTIDVPNLVGGGTNYTAASGVTTLEKLVFVLAKDHGATITSVIVGGATYLKIVVDQVVPIAAIATP
jgi:hypothetical protein